MSLLFLLSVWEGFIKRSCVGNVEATHLIPVQVTILVHSPSSARGEGPAAAQVVGEEGLLYAK